jgi:ASC-1-like (ASCH) protein/N-acetylglutamate synthase-like GNAT family acetyltransferase
MFSSSSALNDTIARSPQSLTFYPVVDKCKHLPILKEIFKTVLEPLYGSQEQALNKIILGQDRKCFLLYEQENPVGLVAFKTLFTDEFASFGLQKSIEIKSLFVVNAEKNSGRGLGLILLNKVVEETNKLMIGHESFHVTVSENKSESLNFFQRRGFKIINEWEGKYVPNVKEYLLSCSTKSLEVYSPAKSSIPAPHLSLSPEHPQTLVFNEEDTHFNLPPAKSHLKRKREEENQDSPRVAKKSRPNVIENSLPLTSSSIKKQYLELIRRGTKTVEGRINSGMFARLKVSGIIQFFNGKDKVRCEVIKINQYTSFAAMLESEGVSSCLPDVNSLARAIQIYNEIPNYAAKAAKYGVLAIHLKVIPT